MTDPVKIDAADLTLGELAELEETMGTSLDQIMEQSQARGIAGIAWLVRRRDVPDFTFDDALALRMSDLEMITAGEVPAATNGGAPRSSPVPGP